MCIYADLCKSDMNMPCAFNNYLFYFSEFCLEFRLLTIYNEYLSLGMLLLQVTFP